MPIFSLLQDLTSLGAVSSRVDPYVREVNGTDKVRVAYGVAAFVSGAATVVTGLATIASIQVELIQTGAATGATEITSASVSGTTGAAIATGTVVLQGFRLNTSTASASGTGGFFWMAFGT